ncbi:MAG: universal stress protein [Acidiferrobacterales bacterium]|nr:universal stress protein [Acidiferrobacterales bacterium]
MATLFKKILVPIDMQELAFADKAVATAVEVARHQQATLHIMTVIPGFGMPIVASYFPPNAMQQASNQVKKELQAYVSKTVPNDVTATCAVAEGTPYEQVIAEAKKVKADLIVLHSHVRKHMEKVLLGSCAQKVVEHAPCSVWVLRD